LFGISWSGGSASPPGAFLRGARGRAALKYGGLISGIASLSVENREVVRGVVAPDFVCAEFGDHFLVDDGLSYDDLDMISGVYYITNPDGRVLTYSWFPPARYWSYGAYNTGFWSDDAEHWFVKRLNELEAPTGGIPKTAREWRKELQGHSRYSQINEARMKVGWASESVLLGKALY